MLREKYSHRNKHWRDRFFYSLKCRHLKYPIKEVCLVTFDVRHFYFFILMNTQVYRLNIDRNYSLFKKELQIFPIHFEIFLSLFTLPIFFLHSNGISLFGGIIVHQSIYIKNLGLIDQSIKQGCPLRETQLYLRKDVLRLCPAPVFILPNWSFHSINT